MILTRKALVTDPSSPHFLKEVILADTNSGWNWYAADVIDGPKECFFALDDLEYQDEESQDDYIRRLTDVAVPYYLWNNKKVLFDYLSITDDADLLLRGNFYEWDTDYLLVNERKFVSEHAILESMCTAYSTNAYIDRNIFSIAKKLYLTFYF